MTAVAGKAVATAGVPSDAIVDGAAPDQRGRILDTALRLMAESGVHAMSMRALAGACGLNVATIYHYFPSKQALLREVIAHQSYEEQLAELPPVDREAPLHERLVGVLRYVWMRMDEQTDMWRLLLGESLRSDPEALSSAADLSATFEAGLNHWLDELCPDLPGDRVAAARVLRGAIYGFYVETLAMPPAERLAYLAPRADEIARVLAR